MAGSLYTLTQRWPNSGLAGFGSAVVMFGSCVPLANHAFLDANPGRTTEVSTGVTHLIPNKPGDGLMMAMGDYRRVGGAHLPASMFMNDVNLVQLARKIAGGPESGGWNAIRWTSFFFAYLAACAMIPVLASVLNAGTLSSALPALPRPPSCSGPREASLLHSASSRLSGGWVPTGFPSRG
jgi:hypothetical protein